MITVYSPGKKHWLHDIQIYQNTNVNIAYLAYLQVILGRERRQRHQSWEAQGNETAPPTEWYYHNKYLLLPLSRSRLYCLRWWLTDVINLFKHLFLIILCQMLSYCGVFTSSSPGGLCEWLSRCLLSLLPVFADWSFHNPLFRISYADRNSVYRLENDYW